MFYEKPVNNLKHKNGVFVCYICKSKGKFEDGVYVCGEYEYLVHEICKNSNKKTAGLEIARLIRLDKPN